MSSKFSKGIPIDFGSAIGIRKTATQIITSYQKEDLILRMKNGLRIR
jgi:hypothetical protein